MSVCLYVWLYKLFEAVGKEPRIVKAPVALFDAIINTLDFLARFLPEQFEDPAELAKIGKYYAVEDMLTTDSSEKARCLFFIYVVLCVCRGVGSGI